MQANLLENLSQLHPATQVAVVVGAAVVACLATYGMLFRN